MQFKATASADSNIGHHSFSHNININDFDRLQQTEYETQQEM